LARIAHKSRLTGDKREIWHTGDSG